MNKYFARFSHIKIKTGLADFYLIDQDLNKIYGVNQELYNLMKALENNSIDFVQGQLYKDNSKKFFDILDFMISKNYGVLIEYKDKIDVRIIPEYKSPFNELLLIDIYNSNIDVKVRDHFKENSFYHIEVKLNEKINYSQISDYIESVQNIARKSIIVYLNKKYYSHDDLILDKLNNPKIYAVVYYNCQSPVKNNNSKNILQIKNNLSFTDKSFLTSLDVLSENSKIYLFGKDRKIALLNKNKKPFKV